MVSGIEHIRRIQVIEHPTLSQFNEEFGTDSDISRYETIRSAKRPNSPELAFLNEMQLDAFIPTRTALLLKNNLHDTAFITFTTRSVLYQLKQKGVLGEACFDFLHKKLNAGDFTSVFRYLQIMNLYSKIAQAHNAAAQPAFNFESVSQYSDRLVKITSQKLAEEEWSLQQQTRTQFLKTWLAEIAGRSNCPREVQQHIFKLSKTLDPLALGEFRTQFLQLLDKLENAPELEKFCWSELRSTLSAYSGAAFFGQAYLRLKTENYYKNCISRVAALRKNLENTHGSELLELAEKCKKAYNGCIYLLGDHKNMSACSPTRFAALSGNMRSEWQLINNAFNRARTQFSHQLCSCHAQAPANQNELAEWPFATHSLVSLDRPKAISPTQLQARGISQAAFNENAKKTVAVIGCNWGGGHREVARGVCNNLTSLGYHPVTVDLPEVLISQDPVRNSFITRWLGKDWTIGTLWNGLGKEKAFAFMNFLRWITSKFSGSVKYTEIELKLVIEHLLKLKPDSVVTTYSLHNEVLIKACEMLGIPCIHIATDIDNTIETRDRAPSSPLFKMALPFNVPEAVNPVTKTTTESQRIFTGLPVKHEFTLPRTPEDIIQLKQEWGIDIDKKVIIVSSGKDGNFSPFPEILAKKYANKRPEEIPIHLVVLCGENNGEFQRHLEKNVRKKSNLPMTIKGFSPKNGRAHGDGFLWRPPHRQRRRRDDL